ncbi:hypothetical protein CDAR_285021 [Caerostris darwini]|uniref:Uncharacterized protein n=1 Tax=Caerostris darwini TaxID=1538125 RepID=A0AAV4ND84_9ARAC|nr:hypothetical protein CDAR_285021 [Caerostris darwini]
MINGNVSADVQDINGGLTVNHLTHLSYYLGVPFNLMTFVDICEKCRANTSDDDILCLCCLFPSNLDSHFNKIRLYTTTICTNVSSCLSNTSMVC